jgi:hypothetical protein
MTIVENRYGERLQKNKHRGWMPGQGKHLVAALLLVAFLLALGWLSLPIGMGQAHAATVDPPCLQVKASITPSRNILPLTEILSVSVTNACGETVNGATLAITDHIRCGSGRWVIDLQTTVGPQVLAPDAVMAWWITGEQTGCPFGENGPFQQWLYGQASGTGASTGDLDSGQGNAYLNLLL